MSIPISGGGNKEVNFNLASLSGAMASQAWISAFVQGSISSSASSKQIDAIDSGIPQLAMMVDTVQVQGDSNKIMIAMLKGWSDSLHRESEIALTAKERKDVADHALANGAAEKLHVSAGQQSIDAHIQKIMTVDKGSDGDKVFLAAHQANAPSLHGTNLDPRHDYLIGLQVMADHARMHLQQMEHIPAPETAGAVDSLAGKPSPNRIAAEMFSTLVLATAVPIAIAAPAVATATTAIAAPVVVAGVRAESDVVLVAWNVLTQQTSGQPQTALAGWFASIWGMGQVYQNAAENLQKMNGQKRSQQSDVDFAKTYAERLVGNLQQPEFGVQMSNLITQTVKGSSPTSLKDAAHLVAMGKVALLATALALILKTEEGVANELNFMGVLANGMSEGDKKRLNALLPDNKGLTTSVDLSVNDLYQTASIKRMLAQQIHDLLDQLPAERDQILINLIAYMSERPSIERLLDHQDVLHGTLQPVALDQDVAFRQMSGS